MKKLFIAFAALVLVISTLCIGASAITVPSNDVVRAYSPEEDGIQIPVDGDVAIEEDGETAPFDTDSADDATASIFGEGSFTLIVAFVALVASAASIVVNLSSRKKENSHADKTESESKDKE